jgi:hypothetical protein
MLLKLSDHLVEVGIARAEAPREPVSTPFGDPLAIGYHFELTRLSGLEEGINSEPLLDHGHETRDLGLVVLSGGAMNNFDFHGVLKGSGRNSMLFPPRSDAFRPPGTGFPVHAGTRGANYGSLPTCYP